jgi:hypothetical protein
MLFNSPAFSTSFLISLSKTYSCSKSCSFGRDELGLLDWTELFVGKVAPALRIESPSWLVVYLF